MRPQELEGRYESIPLSIQWSENLLKTPEENVSIFFGKKEHKIFDVDMEIEEHTLTGTIIFNIVAEGEKSTYQIEFNNTKCTYSLVQGKEVKIKRYSGDSISFIDYMDKDPITIMYSDGSFSYNNFHVPTPPLNSFFNIDNLHTIDWSNTNIRIESLGKEEKRNSIQNKISEVLKEDYEVIFNDDSSGEAADLIAIRQESNDSFKLHLIHCKFSSSDKPGARINDFYTLCGQAQKCIRWKHNGMEYLVNHMKKRNEKWQQFDKTRFLKGTMTDVIKLKKFSRYATNFVFEISIVQPGLSKKLISTDIIQLLANTEDYVLKTSGAKLNVFCSQ